MAACVLGLTGTAGAANRISGDWNAGHGIFCVYYNNANGSAAACTGYTDSHHRSENFLLEGQQTLQTGRAIGQPPDATQRPPAHWQHITAGLQCRRGPGMILVQCRDRHGSFALSAHSWTGQEFRMLCTDRDLRHVHRRVHGHAAAAPLGGTTTCGP